MTNDRKPFPCRFTTAALLAVAVAAVAVAAVAGGCDNDAKSTSGVAKATVKVQTGSDGLTVEQRNVKERVLMDNKPGSVKHLYVIAPESGQCILYSTVQGKVTSSGKRLSPSSVSPGFTVKFGDRDLTTNEVLSDDGTYGSSDPYIFWWDVRGVYHQHFMTGGQIVHVSSEPVRFKSIMVNLEQDTAAPSAQDAKTNLHGDGK